MVELSPLTLVFSLWSIVLQGRVPTLLLCQICCRAGVCLGCQALEKGGRLHEYEQCLKCHMIMARNQTLTSLPTQKNESNAQVPDPTPLAPEKRAKAKIST